MGLDTFASTSPDVKFLDPQDTRAFLDGSM